MKLHHNTALGIVQGLEQILQEKKALRPTLNQLLKQMETGEYKNKIGCHCMLRYLSLVVSRPGRMFAAALFQGVFA